MFWRCIFAEFRSWPFLTRRENERVAEYRATASRAAPRRRWHEIADQPFGDATFIGLGLSLRSGACSYRPPLDAEQQVGQLLPDRHLCSRWAAKTLPLQFGADISQHGGALRLDQRLTSRLPRPDLRKPERVPAHRYPLKHVIQHRE